MRCVFHKEILKDALIQLNRTPLWLGKWRPSLDLSGFRVAQLRWLATK